jgi:predicted phosphate transport protein (TIGR00153 family)
MPVPDEMKTRLLALTERCVEVVNMAAEVIGLFDELLEVGFRGTISDKVEQLIKQINLAESDTDRMERELAGILFTLEGTLDPVTVMFWYQILEWIGDLADYAEKVGNNFRLIIAR